MAIYQARFLKYLHGRGLADTETARSGRSWATARWTSRRAWARSRSAGARSSTTWSSSSTATCSASTGRCAATARSSRSSRAIFRGAGWNVIKVIWGSGWDELLATDTSGILLKRMEEWSTASTRTSSRRTAPMCASTSSASIPSSRRMVADWSDDEIWALTRGGHDPLKVYAAYHAAQHHKGQPTVILAKTVKGYGMGEAGEGQNITHQQKKMGETHCASSATASACRSPTSSSRRSRSSASRRAARSSTTCASGARRSAATCRRGGRSRQPLEVPPLVGLRGPAQGHRRARDLDHDGVRAHPQHAAARQEDRQARGADRAGRIAHLRHGGHVPPVRHLQPGRPALPAGGRQPAHVLQGGQDRPDAAGGHQRGRGHVVLDRGGDVLQHERRADDPVLHLLLDVRLPARRRPRLGGRRHAGARLPDRRHRRAHHAQRRGPAARGRPQPHLLGDDPELRLLRPDLRLRGRGDRPGRPAPHVCRAGGRLLLPDGDERELRASRPCRRAPRQASSRACTCCSRREGQGPRQGGTARAAPGLRHHPARGDRRRRPAARGLRRRRRRLERAELHRARPRGGRRRALEPAAPDRAAAQELRRDLPRRPRRAGRRRDRLHAALRRPDPALRAAAATACSAPTASAAPTTARSCATSSRSTATG